MVAAGALFDGPLTFLIRTHLSVNDDPGEVLTFRAIFDLPGFEHLAVGGPVLLVAASKAEGITAQALDDGVDRVLLVDALDSVVALFGVRTPLDVPVVVSERLAVPSQVPLELH